MPKTAVSFMIDTEVTPEYLGELLKFIHRNYVLPHARPYPPHFTNVKQTVVNHDYVLAFTAVGPKRKWYVDVEMRAGKPIQVKLVPSGVTVPQKALDVLKGDLIFGVQLFEERVRRTTLYFAWVKGEEPIPEKAPLKRRRIISRLFFENMIFLFMIFMSISIFLFIFLGPYAPIVIVASQFILVLFSSKIMLRMGEWRITEKNPNVHLLQYHPTVEEQRAFQQKYSRDALLKIKKEIYEKTLAVGKEIDRKIAEEVFSKYGFKGVLKDMSTRTLNVYQIVKNAAEKFNLPIPKIIISNTVLPNAAASGPSPKHGIVLITTGLLAQLKEDEILSVVGHEFSHLKGRDPLVLFALTSSEYLLRIYVFWPLVILFGFFYILFALGAVYFIAKFFEARADLESAVKIGRPRVLAEALRKIGYRKLQFERLPAYRIQSWINLDPHPPVYFRVSRLENLNNSKKVKYPLIQSIKDTIRGFLAAFH